MCYYFNNNTLMILIITNCSYVGRNILEGGRDGKRTSGLRLGVAAWPGMRVFELGCKS
jgi:hypothetical protein